MIAAQKRKSTEQEGFFLSARRPVRRSGEKFSIIRDLTPSCSLRTNLEWPASSMDADMSSADHFRDSIEESFRQAAEKVDNKIVMNRKIYGGAPCVAETRVHVYAILELVEAGYSHKKILKSFPAIGQEGLHAALQFAGYVMER